MDTIGVHLPGVIDGVGDDQDGTTVLTMVMVPEQPWDDVPSRLKELEAKVASYRKFVTSGQLTDHFPESRGKLVTFLLMCRVDPTLEALAPLRALRDQLRLNGEIRFRVLVSPAGGAPRYFSL
jgi:hypothetical protein